MCVYKGTHGFNKLVSGCNKCTQISTTRSGSSAPVFKPYSAELRTDESFRLRLHPDLHLIGFKGIGSVLLESLGIGMITQFPIDPMHSVDLGVMKLILRLLISRKIYGAPLNKISIAQMNSLFCSFSRHTPSDFQRKPRDLLSCGNFKASECRQVLLYTGMVLFKNYFSAEAYNHFIHLSVAYRILNSKLNDFKLNEAQIYLEQFVKDFHIFFKSEQLTYNVHSLLHLVADCKLYGPVYEFSAYKFENEMGKIRAMVRSKYRKLEQIYNRTMENMLFSKKCTYDRNSLFKIVANYQDSYFSLTDGRIVRVEAVCEDGTYNVRFLYITGDELFVQPRLASSLGIYICRLGYELGKISRHNIFSKLYRMTCTDNNEGEDVDEEEDCFLEENLRQDMNFTTQFVVVPLLHSPYSI